MKYYVVFEPHIYHFFVEYVQILLLKIQPTPNLIAFEDVKSYMNGDNIFICVRTIPEILKTYPRNKLYLVNLEQLTSPPFFSLVMADIKDGISIIDYSIQNFDILIASKIPRNMVYYIPYCPNMSEIYNYEKIYNCCTIGTSDRRRIIHGKIPNLDVIMNAWYKERDELVFRYKILVNIHERDERMLFESVRCNRCVFNKMIVITEKSLDDDRNPLKEYMIICNLDELPEMVQKVLSNYDEYYQKLFGNFDIEHIKEKFDRLTDKIV